MDLYVFDIDGVLADSSHRFRTMPCGTRIDLDYWRANSTPEKIMQDAVLPAADIYRKAIARGEHVVIATARVMTDACYAWIETHLGMPDLIISRPAESTESGAVMKARGVCRVANWVQPENAFIYEDNEKYLRSIESALKPIVSNVEANFIKSNQGF